MNGNYSEWSEFTECSTTCEGGQRRRSRTCTNPPPRHGGKDCKDLGRDVEYIDCNGDVRCPGEWIFRLIEICFITEMIIYAVESEEF